MAGISTIVSGFGLLLVLCSTAVSDTPKGGFTFYAMTSGFGTTLDGRRKLPSCGASAAAMLDSRRHLRVVYSDKQVMMDGEPWAFDSDDGTTVGAHDPSVTGRFALSIDFSRVHPAVSDPSREEEARAIVLYWGVDEHGIDMCADVRVLRGAYRE